MNLQITSDDIEMSPSMKTLAENKINKILGKISKNTPEDLIDIRIVLNKGDVEDTFDAKVVFQLGGMKIVGVDNNYTLESALVEAINDALRQFEKKKSKGESNEWEERRKMKVYNE